jgi:hypothetical protein
MPRALAATIALLLLAGCASDARDVDYTAQRAISADIDASYFRGATNTFPGLSSHDEPIGAYSWQLD